MISLPSQKGILATQPHFWGQRLSSNSICQLTNNVRYRWASAPETWVYSWIHWWACITWTSRPTSRVPKTAILRWVHRPFSSPPASCPPPTRHTFLIGSHMDLLLLARGCSLRTAVTDPDFPGTSPRELLKQWPGLSEQSNQNLRGIPWQQYTLKAPMWSYRTAEAWEPLGSDYANRKHTSNS